MASIFDRMKSSVELLCCVLVSVTTPPISEKCRPAWRDSPPQKTSWYVCWWVFTASFDIAIPDYIAVSVCESRCQANDDRTRFKAKLRGLSSEKWLPIKGKMLFCHHAAIKWWFNNRWYRNFPEQTFCYVFNGLITSRLNNEQWHCVILNTNKQLSLNLRKF